MPNLPPTSPGQDVLRAFVDWRRAGLRVALITVLDTYGSSPRPPGSLAALAEDGRVAGGISGGCVEDALAQHLQARWQAATPPPACECLHYGRDAQEQHRLRLPCGKQVHLCVEYAADLPQTQALLQALEQRQLVQRRVHYASGQSRWQPLPRHAPPPGFAASAEGFAHTLGPSHRLLLIGANDVAACVTPMAQALGFDVTVCEPREAQRRSWPLSAALLDARMPDDLVQALQCDARTAVLALSHDPKLDDLALMEALPSPCFYVGVVGARASVAARQQRLALFDVSPAQLARLRSPAGLPIGSRTPAQIAVSVLAELVAVQNQTESPAEGARPAPSPGCALT